MLVHGEWLLTAQRAALHLPTATAVIADLHLGYDAIRRHCGEAIPAVGLDETVASLSALHAGYDVRRLVIAGDLFEDARISWDWKDFMTWLGDTGIELAGVIPGNHDHRFPNLTCPMPVCPNGVRLGTWRVVHGNGDLPERGCLVHGHLHPSFRWRGGVSAPCYLVAPQRIILPAYSDDAAGVNVLREPAWRHYKCFVIAGDEVLDFGKLDELQRAIRTWK
jgi:uncharacterized protein